MLFIRKGLTGFMLTQLVVYYENGGPVTIAEIHSIFTEPSIHEKMCEQNACTFDSS